MSINIILKDVFRSKNQRRIAMTIFRQIAFMSALGSLKAESTIKQCHLRFADLNIIFHAESLHSGIKARAFHSQNFGCAVRSADFFIRNSENVSDIPALQLVERG